MATGPFLAMTAAEIFGNSQLPRKIAWMACHFSPYGLGLSNLPRQLPAGSLLILDDITPIRGHDPQIILEQLTQCAARFSCSGILLDFQRPGDANCAALVEFLSGSLPCSMAVSHFYGDHCKCALCVPPVPLSEPPEGYFSQWKDQELWLEISREGELITVTEDGANITPLPYWESRDGDSFDEALVCHYRQEIRDNAVVFTLYRTEEDQTLLLEKAREQGVTTALGLYQESFRP